MFSVVTIWTQKCYFAAVGSFSCKVAVIGSTILFTYKLNCNINQTTRCAYLRYVAAYKWSSLCFHIGNFQLFSPCFWKIKSHYRQFLKFSCCGKLFCLEEKLNICFCVFCFMCIYWLQVTRYHFYVHVQC